MPGVNGSVDRIEGGAQFVCMDSATIDDERALTRIVVTTNGAGVPKRLIKGEPGEPFGLTLRRARLSLGLSLEDVGSRLGITRQAVSRWELEPSMREDSVRKYASALGAEVVVELRAEKPRG